MFAWLKAKGEDLFADLTLHDNMKRGVYAGVSIACAKDGKVDAAERQSITSTMCSLFKNFEPHEVSRVVLEAIRDHTDAEAGFIVTEELLLGVESEQEGRKLCSFMRLLAKKGDNVIDPPEEQLILRFAQVMGLDPNVALGRAA